MKNQVKTPSYNRGLWVFQQFVASLHLIQGLYPWNFKELHWKWWSYRFEWYAVIAGALLDLISQSSHQNQTVSTVWRHYIACFLLYKVDFFFSLDLYLNCHHLDAVLKSSCFWFSEGLLPQTLRLCNAANTRAFISEPKTQSTPFDLTLWQIENEHTLDENLQDCHFKNASNCQKSQYHLDLNVCM